MSRRITIPIVPRLIDRFFADLDVWRDSQYQAINEDAETQTKAASAAFSALVRELGEVPERNPQEYYDKLDVVIHDYEHALAEINENLLSRLADVEEERKQRVNKFECIQPERPIDDFWIKEGF